MHITITAETLCAIANAAVEPISAKTNDGVEICVNAGLADNARAVVFRCRCIFQGEELTEATRPLPFEDLEHVALVTVTEIVAPLNESASSATRRRYRFDILRAVCAEHGYEIVDHYFDQVLKPYMEEKAAAAEG